MLYLMQHGQAYSKDEIPDRPLTKAGREEVRSIASRASMITAQQVVHSGKLRAKETADIMAQALEVPCQIREGLGPNDPVPPLAHWLHDQPPTLVVGHLPFLSRLLGYLLDGEESSELVEFRQAGLLCLKDGKLRWIMWPEMVPSSD